MNIEESYKINRIIEIVNAQIVPSGTICTSRSFYRSFQMRLPLFSSFLNDLAPTLGHEPVTDPGFGLDVLFPGFGLQLFAQLSDKYPEILGLMC